MHFYTVIMFKASGEIVKSKCKSFAKHSMAYGYALETSKSQDLWFEIVPQEVA